MNLTEKYALNCGVKIRKPAVGLSYFPVPDNPYIILDNRSRDASSSYDLFSDVIGYIKPILDQHNISILSFSKDENSVIPDTNGFCGLFKKQENFLIKHSLAVVGVNELSLHVANILQIPNIGMYSTYPASSKKPIWNDSHVVIESNRDGNLPSYGAQEQPKTINLIEPEVVARHIFNELKLKDKIPHETFYIGDLYPIKVVEVIPNFAPPAGYMEGKALNLRMDYHFDERLAAAWLNNRKLNLLTKKPINLKLLNYFKKNIAQLTININDSFSDTYLRDAQALGINVQIFCEDADKLNDLRFEFFDFEINESLFKKKEDLDDAKSLVNDKTKFLTGKILLSEGKKYSCFEAKKAGKELTNQPELIYDTDEFWKELDHYRLINEL